MNNKTASIPRLQYVWVDTRFTHHEPCGWKEAEWVQTVAIPDRAWGITVVFRDGGMCYRGLPPHAISFDYKDNVDWTLDQAQLWNCYGHQYEHMECENLGSSRVVVSIDKDIYHGTYLFQTSFIGDSYSMSPDQDKTFFWIRLDNNRLTIQPTNRVVFRDSSFIIPVQTIPRLKLQTHIYRCRE